MARKKSTKRAGKAASAASETGSRTGSGDRLVGAVWHGGRMYSPAKKGDAAAFAAALEKEKSTDKGKSQSAMLQRLADRGRIVGFGTKAAKSKAAANKPGAGGRARAEAEAEGEGEEGLNPDEQAGGGVDAVEEPVEEEE